ncbi:MAG TPA: hypothetical protein VHM70_30150 [Polyangiaceae bacterium]|nr:hypothetical protein [Polyangiaceae bacterium]
MGENNQEWSWVGEDGTEHEVDEGELTFSLSSEDLPAHILVIKRGWGEWLPAMQVAELQWALPAGRSDNPRKPSAGRKPKPPLDRYASLKQRALDIARGVIDPASESSLAMPVVQLAPRSSPAPARGASQSYRPLSLSDAEEPTLQIDADSLNAALEYGNILRAIPPVAAPRSAPSSEIPESVPTRMQSRPENLPPPAPEAPWPAKEPSAPRVPATGSQPFAAPRPASAFPPAVSNVPRPGSSPELRPLSAAPPGVTATGSYPAYRAPSATPPGSLGPPSPLGRESQSGASSPSFAPVAPTKEHTSGKWLWLVIAAGLVSAAAIALWLRSHRVEPEITAPIQTQVIAPPPPPAEASCKNAVSPLPVAGWIYPNVRPILARAPGANSLLVGYAQTTRMASGLIVDTVSLNSQKPYQSQGNSPLLSVAPVTQALGQQASFLESRAASTLQSAVFVSAKRPFALGSTHDGLAIRREGELQDTVVWKPQWDTFSVPLVTRLDEHTNAVVLRGGGERGSILVGKIDDDARPLGELQELVVDAPRLGTPSLGITSRRVLVAVDAAARDGTRKLYLASAEAPRVPVLAEALPITDDNPTYPGAVALRDGSVLVTYTRGQVGSQSVAARLFGPKRQPLGGTIEISPKDKDAFNAELALDGDRVVILFVVRQGNNSELWATSLNCIAGEK